MGIEKHLALGGAKAEKERKVRGLKGAPNSIFQYQGEKSSGV